jgi:hypothetical protein
MTNAVISRQNARVSEQHARVPHSASALSERGYSAGPLFPTQRGYRLRSE